MSITRNILDWTEKKTDEIDMTDKHPYLKAFGLGSIEGYIDGAIIAYPILLASSIILLRKIK